MSVMSGKPPRRNDASRETAGGQCDGSFSIAHVRGGLDSSQCRTTQYPCPRLHTHTQVGSMACASTRSCSILSTCTTLIPRGYEKTGQLPHFRRQGQQGCREIDIAVAACLPSYIIILKVIVHHQLPHSFPPQLLLERLRTLYKLSVSHVALASNRRGPEASCRFRATNRRLSKAANRPRHSLVPSRRPSQKTAARASGRHSRHRRRCRGFCKSSKTSGVGRSVVVSAPSAHSTAQHSAAHCHAQVATACSWLPFPRANTGSADVPFSELRYPPSSTGRR